MKTSWRELLSNVLKRNNESWKDIIFYSTSINEPAVEWGNFDFTLAEILKFDKEVLLDLTFPNGYSSESPIKVKAWTSDFVYFSREYDGHNYIDCIERNPVKPVITNRK